MPFKLEFGLATLCHSKDRLFFGVNCCVETQLCHERRLFARAPCEKRRLSRGGAERAGSADPTRYCLAARAHRADHQTGLAAGDLIFDRPDMPICVGLESARYDACPGQRLPERRRTQPPLAE